MPRFRKKPVEIDAVQFTGQNRGELPDWLADRSELTLYYGEGKVSGTRAQWATIDTLEGQHRADIGDWVIRGVKGELYPCKPDIFTMTYDAV